MKKYIMLFLLVLVTMFSGHSVYAKTPVPTETPETLTTEESTTEEESVSEEDITTEEKSTSEEVRTEKKDTEKEDTEKKVAKDDGGKASIRKTVMIIVGIVLALILVILIILIILIVRGKKADKADMDDSEDVTKVLPEPEKPGYDVSATPAEGIPLIIDVYRNSEMVESIQVKVDSSLIIGRADICDVVINNENLSSQHMVIEYSDDSFYVQDLDTKNGTLFNGIKMKHKRRLEKGDRLKVGEMELVIRW